jgi:DDE family transposase
LAGGSSQSVLRPAKRPKGTEIRALLRRLLRAIRANWPMTQILLRGDSHYCGPEVIDWCRANRVDFILGVAATSTLRRHTATYKLSGGFKPPLKRFADLDGPDFFPTQHGPPMRSSITSASAARSGKECACGDGAMSRVLENAAREVASSDLFDRGYGEIGHDFLKPSRTARQHRNEPAVQCCRGLH